MIKKGEMQKWRETHMILVCDVTRSARSSTDASVMFCAMALY